MVQVVSIDAHKNKMGGRKVDIDKGATFSRNPLIYLVELAGVEPASEIPTSSVLHA